MTPTLMINMEGWVAVVSPDMEYARRAWYMGVREGHEFCWEHPKFEEVCSIWRRRQWHPTPVLLPGKSHGRRGLVGCSPWGREESDMTGRLHFHFSLSCIGEGNGNPLQCSCLENPRDGGAWWAAVYGVAQSWTRLKRLSSSSSSIRAEISSEQLDASLSSSRKMSGV